MKILFKNRKGLHRGKTSGFLNMLGFFAVIFTYKFKVMLKYLGARFELFNKLYSDKK